MRLKINLLNKLIVSAILFCVAFFSDAKTALIVVAHGSPFQKWNGPTLMLEARLDSMDIPGIDYVRVALMEFSQPDVYSIFADCERENIDSALVFPLFIAPSSHSEDDLPNILGLKYDPEVRKELEEEGTRLVRTNIHIALAPTLSSGDVIKRSMLDRVRSLSQSPQDEAVLLLAHGDPFRKGYWDSLLEETGKYLKANTGIDLVNAKLIQMGYSLADDIRPMAQEAANNKKRIILQGIYLSSSISDMTRGGTHKLKDALGLGSETELVVSSMGILPASCDDVADWIAALTTQWRGAQQ